MRDSIWNILQDPPDNIPGGFGVCVARELFSIISDEPGRCDPFRPETDGEICEHCWLKYGHILPEKECCCDVSSLPWTTLTSTTPGTMARDTERATAASHPRRNFRRGGTTNSG